MRTLSAKDAKYSFGRLIDLARAELKDFGTGHVDSRPSTTGQAE